MAKTTVLSFPEECGDTFTSSQDRITLGVVHKLRQPLKWWGYKCDNSAKALVLKSVTMEGGVKNDQKLLHL
jgi:hypothetical protein